MAKQTLDIEVRKELKKGPSRRLRRMGKIPCVIYGHKETPLPIIVDEHEFNKKFKKMSENILINLKLPTDSHEVLVKDFQEDIVSGKILHIDFYEVEKGRLLRTHIPVHMKGTAEGVKEGGILETFLHEIEVECLPKDIPEEIFMDVTHLEVGHAIHISDIETREGIKILNPLDQVICLVARKKGTEEEEEKEAVEEETEEGEE